MISVTNPPRGNGKILGRINFEFDPEELERFRNPKQLDVDYGSNMEVINFEKREQRSLLPYQKIELLYESQIHGIPSYKIAEKYKICKSATNETISKYKRNGKIFNSLSKFSKVFLMQERDSNIRNQLIYSNYRREA